MSGNPFSILTGSTGNVWDRGTPTGGGVCPLADPIGRLCRGGVPGKGRGALGDVGVEVELMPLSAPHNPQKRPPSEFPHVEQFAIFPPLL